MKTFRVYFKENDGSYNERLYEGPDIATVLVFCVKTLKINVWKIEEAIYE